MTPTLRTSTGIDIAYEVFPGDGPPIVLVMGLGAQMLWWPDGWCQGLADRGFRVIRFDNRDTGLSTRMHGMKPPSIARIALAAALRRRIRAPYTLHDMAADTVGLLDGLGLASAHIVGASMGGMIAQLVALQHPDRVRSLTSIMSTTGDPRVSRPRARALRALVGSPGEGRDAHVAHSLKTFAAIGSPVLPMNEAGMRDIAGRSYDRGPTGVGFLRQFAAIYASGSRHRSLRALDVPTLVIHGEADPLIPVAAGKATAAAIPNARLLLFKDMGHDLPELYWDDMLDAIAAHVRYDGRPSRSQS